MECKESKDAHRRQGTLCQHCCTASSVSRTQGLIDNRAARPNAAQLHDAVDVRGPPPTDEPVSQTHRREADNRNPAALAV